MRRGAGLQQLAPRLHGHFLVALPLLREAARCVEPPLMVEAVVRESTPEKRREDVCEERSNCRFLSARKMLIARAP